LEDWFRKVLLKANPREKGGPSNEGEAIAVIVVGAGVEVKAGERTGELRGDGEGGVVVGAGVRVVGVGVEADQLAEGTEGEV
jgi:hypothetical protein